MHDPERYESNKSAAARDADQFVPMLMDGMSWGRNELILDYGCGAGSTGNKFLFPQADKYDSTIHSVDISENMIQHARKAYSNPRVTFAIGDILHEDFPHKDVKFDKIFAIYVLHFVKNYKEAMKRFMNVLNPGGYVGFTVITKSTLFMLYEKLGRSDKWSKYMKGYEAYIPEWVEEKEDAQAAFRRNLTEIGYEILELCPYRQEFWFERVDTNAELFLSLNPFLKFIPKELHQEMKEEYRVFLRKYWCIPDGTESFNKSYGMLYGLVRKPLNWK